MQVKYSILDRSAETDGTLACCRDLGIAVIAHSPLQQGLLTERALQTGDSATRQQQQVLQPCMCNILLKPGLCYPPCRPRMHRTLDAMRPCLVAQP